MLQAGKDAQFYRRAPPPDATPSGSGPGLLAAPVSPVFSGRDQASAPSMAAPDRGRQMGQRVRHDYGHSIIALLARQSRPAHAPRSAPPPSPPQALSGRIDHPPTAQRVGEIAPGWSGKLHRNPWSNANVI